MALKLFWTDFSLNELKKIFEYYKETAGFHIAKKIVEGIFQESLQLKNQPELGQKEALLFERKQEFRYLIYKNYKIIYWVNLELERIEISDVFDTRQNPQKIKRGKRE